MKDVEFGLLKIGSGLRNESTLAVGVPAADCKTCHFNAR